MTKNVIQTKDAPPAIGPYSQGIEAGSAVYVSGQLPIVPETGELPGNDIASQTRQSLENLKAVLNAANATLENVVKTTVYLADIADFTDMNEVYAEYFRNTCPARAAFQVAALPRGAKVEIEATAVKQ